MKDYIGQKPIDPTTYSFIMKGIILVHGVLRPDGEENVRIN